MKDHYLNILNTVRKEAENRRLTPIINWLDHKDRNPWVLNCVSMATTEMDREDWLSTNKNTNHAESAHAQSQREGIKLSLLSAVEKGMRLDNRQFEAAQAAQSSGISVRYGNNSMSGRVMKKVARKKAVVRKAKSKENSVANGSRLLVAQDLLRQGIRKELVEAVLRGDLSDDI
jgi:hypothetical protein